MYTPNTLQTPENVLNMPISTLPPMLNSMALFLQGKSSDLFSIAISRVKTTRILGEKFTHCFSEV